MDIDEQQAHDNVIKSLLEKAKEMATIAAQYRQQAVKLCRHAAWEPYGGHAYCTVCDKLLGDECHHCGKLKSRFLYPCEECGKS